MLGNTMEPLMREGIETEKEIPKQQKKALRQEVDMMYLTERKVDYLKFVDPRRPLRTAYQTNSQFLSSPQPL